MTTRTLSMWLVFAATLSGQQPVSIDGRDGEIVRSKCLGCHTEDLIVQQRLTRAGWDREIAKMERWSVPLSTPERSQVLAYLADRFGPHPAPVVQSVTNGEDIYRSACRTCHEQDLITQQRLTAAGWERTVDKMVRWGARVTPEQKPALVAFLVSQVR